MRYYSQSTGCTYLESIHGDQRPDDAAPISDERYQSTIASPAPGKVRSHDQDGLPILIDPPPATEEEVATAARVWRDKELAASQWLVDRNRDQEAAGFQLSLAIKQFSELLVYRQALRNWPTGEGFPQDQSQPVPPVWLDETQDLS